jgi:hypothetical protein
VELEGVVEQILHSEADLVKLLPCVVLCLCVPHQLIWDPGLIEPQNPLYGTFWGILNDICLGVGSSYVVSDFAVVESGGSENAPIILGRPFLTTFKAFIYTETAKIVFTINEKTERFSFKNKILRAPAHPNILTLKNTSQLSRRKGGIGGTKRTINLDYTWRKFG